jgi:DNA-binding beta-propeller fold protein YncE
MSGFERRQIYGESGAAAGGTTAPVRFNSPVGALEDRAGNVWIADTGAGRLVIMDSSLSHVVETVSESAAEPNDAGTPLDLPFRLAHHPAAEAVYLTEMGAGRVVRYDYDTSGDGIDVWQTQTIAGPSPFHPNGIATHAYPDGVRIFVADEFAQADQSLRSEILVFDEDGTRTDAFSRVQDDGAADPLYWPQGLAVDEEGLLYIANTGAGILDTEFGANTYGATVLRCDRTGQAVRFSGLADAVFAELAMPRDVTVLGRGRDRTILVPDAATGKIHAYGTNGLEQWLYPGDAFTETPRRAAPEQGLATATSCGRGAGDAAPDADSHDPHDQRLQSPVGITPYSGPDAGQTGLLVTEAMRHEVRALALDLAGPAMQPLAATGRPREGACVFNFPAATALVPSDEGPVHLIADSANGRLLRTMPGRDGDLEAVELPANRFPFGLAVWDTGDQVALAVTDFSTTYAREDDATQVQIYTVHPARDGPWLEHRCGLGTWGLGTTDLRLPRGVAVDATGPAQARLYVADAGNGRVGVWDIAGETPAAAPITDLGVFGHAEGMFWNPADVTIGTHGLYVADANNNRLQRHDGDDWQAFGRPGYDQSRPAFLLPVSIEAAAGYLFVTDLVNRRIEVYEEPRPGGDALTLVDAVGSLGGNPRENDLWMPYALSATPADGDAVTVLVPDGTLNVATAYRWEPPA